MGHEGAALNWLLTGLVGWIGTEGILWTMLLLRWAGCAGESPAATLNLKLAELSLGWQVGHLSLRGSWWYRATSAAAGATAL